MKLDEKKIISWRRHFHTHPELSGNEKETAAYISELLRSFGLIVQENVGKGYGVVGLLMGDPKYQCAALRADMDALPIYEENAVQYCSKCPGVMHACGHDGHMSMVLAAAEYLAKNPPKGSVKFIFQPSEECKPGGAKAMIEAGVLQEPHVDGLFATHVINSYPLGTIAVSDDIMMAASDDFDLTIRGKSGHGAIPHHTIDPIAIAAQIVTAFHQIISRRIDPAQAAVLSICSINTVDTYNVIPQEAIIKGTVRCFDLSLRDKIRDEMNKIAQGICQAWGAKADIDYYQGYPPLVNDPQMAKIIRSAVDKINGVKSEDVFSPPMAGEDFALFAKLCPTAFFFTGTGSEKCFERWHNCTFDIEEEALYYGAQVFIYAAQKIADSQKISH